MPQNTNPLEDATQGYVALYFNSPGLAVGGYSRTSAADVREFAHGDPVVTTIKRARSIARQQPYEWDIATEDEIHNRASRGELLA